MEKFHKTKKTITLAGVSMARVLTDSDTEAMIQRVQPEERDEVGVLCLLPLSIFFFLSTQLCLIVLLISISKYAHLLLCRLSYFTHFPQVNALLEKHKELRRKKSANSFRRDGVTQVAGKENITQLEQQHIFLRDHRL